MIDSCCIVVSNFSKLNDLCNFYGRAATETAVTLFGSFLEFSKYKSNENNCPKIFEWGLINDAGITLLKVNT